MTNYNPFIHYSLQVTPLFPDLQESNSSNHEHGLGSQTHQLLIWNEDGWTDYTGVDDVGFVRRLAFTFTLADRQPRPGLSGA